METREPDPGDALRRRLDRERRARHEAEAIAERVTRELYASQQQLQQLNLDLRGANDELQALNQAMGDFVAVASHDLRNPITAILGAASTLSSSWGRMTDDQRSKFTQMIERQAHQMARMVDDLLTVSRIEAGELDTQQEVIRLREILDRIVADFGERAGEVRVLPNDCLVLADPSHLERILVNYLGNAFKYGAPPVEIEARPDGEWVEIRISDHGDGVPPDFVPRLFGKFARAESGPGGTGLGLSIVRGLARANDGDTWYEPKSPHGSCFAIRLRAPAA